MNNIIIGIVCISLLCIVLYELFKDRKYSLEGFSSNSQSYMDKFYPKRSDIVPGNVKDESPWVRDLRYKDEYVDIQKLGHKSDLCRVVVKPGDPGSAMLACGLAGTDGVSSLTYHSKSKADGLKLGRDDYYKDVNSDSRDDYCRIIKVKDAPDDLWESWCVVAGLDSFVPQEIRDSSPPETIKDMLWFYDGIMVWYRFKDDLLDYGENTHLALAGDIKIDENPRKPKTDGIQLNPVRKNQIYEPPVADQYIRIGENNDLEVEEKLELRQLRAFSFWVHFDMFSNNARIFDFGNGAGHDNIFIGIEGKGNNASPLNSGKKEGQPANVVCSQKAPKELLPQDYLNELIETSGPQPIDNDQDMPENQDTAQVKRANLLFEIWDKQQRKMRIKILDAVQERKWHHIAFTTRDLSFTPTWEVYIDGALVYTHPSGHLAQTNYTTKNYIGRSNWENAQGQGEYKDERFRGSLFDFRMYRIPMPQTKIQKTIQWGKTLLNLNSSDF